MASNSTLKQNKNSVSNKLLNGVITIVNRRTQPWTGTMTELDLALVNLMHGSTPTNWPGSPSALRVALNRVVKRIRGAGISVRFSRSTDHSRSRLVEFSIRK